MESRPALEWVASLPVTCLHAAEALCFARMPPDGPLPPTIAALAQSLGDEIRAAGLPWEQFWQHLVPLAAQSDNPKDLVQRSLLRTVGNRPRNELVAPRIAARVSELLRTFRRESPELLETLDDRSWALRGEWESVGRHVLGIAADLTEPGIVPESATVIVVDAVQGGAGAAHLLYNSVRIEALPPGLPQEPPEVVRLAWLLAQLNHDLPIYSEPLPAARLSFLAAVATLVPTLAAAAQHGLIEDATACLPGALESWGIACPPTSGLADTLLAWWRTYEEAKPSWTVALAALDRLLGAEDQASEK